MFYKIENNVICESNIDEILNETPSVGYLDMSEFSDHIDSLGLQENELKEYISDISHRHTAIDVYDDYSIAMVNVVSLEGVMCKCDKIAFIIKRNQFLVIKIDDDDDSTMFALESAVKRFKQNATLEKIIFGTIDILLTNGNQNLEEYEKHIMEMEEKVVFGNINQELNKEIFEMRNRLAVLRNYYEQLVDIGEKLEENENDIFPQEDLRYFKIFSDKAQRLSDNVQMLGESLIHLREAIDASLNYNMNKIMKVFTVVSVIFLPLTLITGWYGMNFQNMPELTWKMGYLGVALFSVAVLIICLIYFKKKKWL